MKQRYIIILILLSGCLTSPDVDKDMSGDQNNSEDVNEDVQDINQRPTYDECEMYTTERSCFEAGCRIFHDVTVFSSVNGVCSEGTPGTVCWTTLDGDLLPTGLETTYFREESDGTTTVVLAPFGYNQNVLGWESCLGDCLCATFL